MNGTVAWTFAVAPQHKRFPPSASAAQSSSDHLALAAPRPETKCRSTSLCRGAVAPFPVLSAGGGVGSAVFGVVPSALGPSLEAWLKTAKQTSLRTFAQGVERDHSALEATLYLPWSNGPVEGHVHRLKLIKRQGYGRANFDLLKQRVLQAA